MVLVPVPMTYLFVTAMVMEDQGLHFLGDVPKTLYKIIFYHFFYYKNPPVQNKGWQKIWKILNLLKMGEYCMIKKLTSHLFFGSITYPVAHMQGDELLVHHSKYALYYLLLTSDESQARDLFCTLSWKNFHLIV